MIIPRKYFQQILFSIFGTPNVTREIESKNGREYEWYIESFDIRVQYFSKNKISLFRSSRLTGKTSSYLDLSAQHILVISHTIMTSIRYLKFRP